MNKLLIITTLLLACFSVKGQIPNHFIFDKNQSQQFGSENIITTHNLLYNFSDSLIPHKLWNEEKIGSKIGGIGYRAIKFGLLDFQIDWLLQLIQHEVFGHGSRFREFGYSDISYELDLLYPYGQAEGHAHFNNPWQYLNTTTQITSHYLAGSEANNLMASNLEERMLLNNQIHYRQGSLYLISKNDFLLYLTATITNFENGGDMENYISSINPNTPFGSGPYTSEKLFKQSLISLINPMQIYSAWAIGKNYLLDGNSTMPKIPTIKIKEIGYLPAFNYNLTPFGSEYILNQYFIKGNRLLTVKARLGDNTFHSFYGGGFKIANLIDKQKIKLGINLEGWQQPSFQLSGETIKNVDEGFGVLANTAVSYFPFTKIKKFGVYSLIGYKTEGYVIGEQLDKGIILRFGLSLNLN
jgi:hypothetical protein